jgi:hypothetical protein
MKRSALRRRPRRDAVPATVALTVFARDKGCLAPRLGGSAADCWGKLRLEHVKREARMGRRGDLLGTLCEGHTEPGMKAGYVWCTDARNRQAMREHLLSLEDGCTHVDRRWDCSTCMARVMV